MREETLHATDAHGPLLANRHIRDTATNGISRLAVLIVSFVDFDPGRVKTK